jgi:hypothetical protein
MLADEYRAWGIPPTVPDEQTQARTLASRKKNDSSAINLSKNGSSIAVADPHLHRWSPCDPMIHYR